MAREMALMDKTTILNIAKQSCGTWFNLRMQYTGKLLTALGIMSCLVLKGRVDNIVLALMLTYTAEMDWV